MSFRAVFFSGVLFASASAFAAEATHKLVEVGKLPEGVSKDVAAKINAKGMSLTGPSGPVCDLWLAKELAIKDNFKPTLAVKYPFTPGQLIGVLKVSAKSGYTDFRGQEMKPGVFTLRYGQQPEDGNHIGTSELADFLLALPAKKDTDPKTIAGFDKLAQRSAGSVGSTHPAIFSLLPTKAANKKSTVQHDEDHEFWIIDTSVVGKLKDKTQAIALRMIAIGKAEE